MSLPFFGSKLCEFLAIHDLRRRVIVIWLLPLPFSRLCHEKHGFRSLLGRCVIIVFRRHIFAVVPCVLVELRRVRYDSLTRRAAFIVAVVGFITKSSCV